MWVDNFLSAIAAVLCFNFGVKLWKYYKNSELLYRAIPIMIACAVFVAVLTFPVFTLIAAGLLTIYPEYDSSDNTSMYFLLIGVVSIICGYLACIIAYDWIALTEILPNKISDVFTIQHIPNKWPTVSIDVKSGRIIDGIRYVHGYIAPIPHEIGKYETRITHQYTSNTTPYVKTKTGNNAYILWKQMLREMLKIANGEVAKVESRNTISNMVNSVYIQCCRYLRKLKICPFSLERKWQRESSYTIKEIYKQYSA